MEILKAILFGIVEGITEWLPISSTGHLILLEQWVKFNLEPDRAAAFTEFYEIVIQLAAIMAVVVVYWKVLWPFGIAKAGADKAPAKSKKKQTRDEQVRKLVGSIVLKEKIFWMWVKIVIACIPGVLYGLFLDDLIETMTEPYQPIIVAVMLIRRKLKAVEGSPLKIFNANSATILPSLRAGCAGFSGVMANFHPELYADLCACYKTDPARAEALQAFLGGAFQTDTGEDGAHIAVLTLHEQGQVISYELVQEIG